MFNQNVFKTSRLNVTSEKTVTAKSLLTLSNTNNITRTTKFMTVKSYSYRNTVAYLVWGRWACPQLQVRTAVSYGNFDHIMMALMPYVNIKVTGKKTNHVKFQVLIRLARLFFISANLSTTGLTSSKSAELKNCGGLIPISAPS